ncbi:transcriptional repressor [Candidatus Actinomarina sp.]|jgi:Fur family ferric uptake transcriptional regulator|nr:transcriptional repressor [Candidatus Actinomarina sp.]
MNLIGEIKKKGHRVTKSRELICEILENSGHAHFTVDELYKKVTKKSSEVDLATVYRTLELLGQIGLIAHLHQAHGSGIYFLRNEENIMHLICMSCERIIDISFETFTKINKLLMKETKFKSINNNFIYSGICENCK